MKTFAPPCKIVTGLVLLFSCLTLAPMKAQTIEINTTFYSDEVIFPFNPEDTLYGISISGSVALYGDTSLVRIILTDTYGFEWMIYEAYPLIVADSVITLTNECDETCYLDKTAPYSITIQLVEAQINITTLNLNSEYRQNYFTLQNQAKRSKDQAKIQQMYVNIQTRGWNWTADTTSLVKLFYLDKVQRFGTKYNLLGLDYYSGGIFRSKRHATIPQYLEYSVIPSFDWREQHNANISTSFYYGGDSQDSTNGWMTPVKDQKGCGACAAFACIASLEAAINLYANYHFDIEEDTRFSDRHAFNCSIYSGDTIGCNCLKGKSRFEILDFLKEQGVVDYFCYPYDTPFCEGLGFSCEEVAQSICDTPSMTAQIYNYKTHGLYQGDSIQRVAFLKTKLISEGPLTIQINNWPWPQSDTTKKKHALSLVGFKTINDTLFWIYKNSWDTTFGVKGYGFEPFWVGADAPPGVPYIASSVYAFNYDDTCSNAPISVICHKDCGTPGFTYYVHDYDKDKDGYYNWGIGQKPDIYPCSQEEDSNDDDNRVGPFDTDFSGKTIAPAMHVQQGTSLWGNPFENGAFVNISVDTLYDTTFIFQIKNSGTAQLNLEQYTLTDNGIVTIDYQYPSGQFEIDTLPHKFVCMDKETTTFKIKMFQGAVPGSLAHIHIHMNEPDMDSIFEFTLVYNGCETLEGFDSINSEVEWSDTCRAQCRDLHIQRNGILIVSDTVMLSPDADIIIEPGGKMILDGGKLTRLCSSELWNGIQVWGDSSLSQYGDTNQGYLGIRNGGIIEYAVTGVFIGKIIDGDTLYAGSGGVIEAEDAIFLNNETDVEFLPFINKYLGYSNETPNISIFRNSIFKTCDPDGLIDSVNQHVLLDGVNGVDFYACSFSLEDTEGQSIDEADKGTGILAFDAQVYVKGRCTSQSTPCTSYDSCYFKNLRYGIRAFGTGGFQYLDVSESVFDENTAGIYLSGYHLPSVTSSSFKTSPGHELISGQESAFYGGLYMDGSSGYQVENNYFSGPNATVPDSGSVKRIGIYVKDSGEDDNEIYNNYFLGLDAGIVAEGINKGKETGLCLKCNDFRTCLNDMMVSDSAFYYTGKGAGIKENQGTDTTLSYMLAGNTFTPEVQGLQAIDNGGDEKYFWSYFNNADHFNYFHHAYNSNFVTFPEDTTNYSHNAITLTNEFVLYIKEYACPTNPTGPGYKSMEDPRIEITEAEIQLLALQSKYDSLLDGGNTEDLDFEIITSMPDEALELRDQLLSDSPYLSDTILKQAIYKETVLPNSMIRDVLSVNPQSAKSGEILDAVDSRYDPMPDYMMADIMQGFEQIGALESLESKIGYWSNYRSRAVNMLIREFLSDTTIINPADSLIQLLQDETSMESTYRLAFSYWENNLVEHAQITLNDIPMDFELSNSDQLIYENYVNYFDVLQTLKDSNLNIRQLDSSYVQNLITIMNSGLPLISTYARNLLIKGRHISFMESVAFPAQVKSYPGFYYLNPNKTKFSEEEYLVVFPNPCGDFVIAYFNTTHENRLGMLSIRDMQGKELDKIKLNSLKNQLTLNLSYYPTGVYIISLIVDDILKSSMKLVKSRK